MISQSDRVSVVEIYRPPGIRILRVLKNGWQTIPEIVTYIAAKRGLEQANTYTVNIVVMGLRPLIRRGLVVETLSRLPSTFRITETGVALLEEVMADDSPTLAKYRAWVSPDGPSDSSPVSLRPAHYQMGSLPALGVGT